MEEEAVASGENSSKKKVALIAAGLITAGLLFYFATKTVNTNKDAEGTPTPTIEVENIQPEEEVIREEMIEEAITPTEEISPSPTSQKTPTPSPTKTPTPTKGVGNLQANPSNTPTPTKGLNLVNPT